MLNKKSMALVAVAVVLLAMTITYVTATNEKQRSLPNTASTETNSAGFTKYWMSANDYGLQKIYGCSIVNGVNITTPSIPSAGFKAQIIFSSETIASNGSSLNIHAKVDGITATGPEFFATNPLWETRTGQYIVHSVTTGPHTVQIEACGDGYLWYKDASLLLSQ